MGHDKARIIEPANPNYQDLLKSINNINTRKSRRVMIGLLQEYLNQKGKQATANDLLNIFKKHTLQGLHLARAEKVVLGDIVALLTILQDDNKTPISTYIIASVILSIITDPYLFIETEGK